MKLNYNSFSSKLYRWIYYSDTNEMPSNLCPYFWKLVFENVRYRMDEEGFHYCFDGYSKWGHIKDEEFHKLRINYLESAKLLREYVDKKLLK